MNKKKYLIYGAIFLLLIIGDLIVITWILYERNFFSFSKEVKPDYAANELLSIDETAKLNETGTTEALGNVNVNIEDENNVNIEIPPTEATETLETTETEIVQNPKYVSTGLNLSLEMPVSFHVAAGLDLSSDFFQAMTYDDLAPYDPNTLGVKIEILSADNKKELSLIEWAGHSVYYQEGVPDFVETEVFGYPALEQETLTKVNGSKSYIIGKAKKVYIIEYSGDLESYHQYLEAFHNIINSIKFL